MSDERGYAGNIHAGWRTVRNGGLIKFDQFVFSSEKLVSRKGQRVYCEQSGDYGSFYTPEITVRDEELGKLICVAVNCRQVENK